MSIPRIQKYNMQKKLSFFMGVLIFKRFINNCTTIGMFIDTISTSQIWIGGTDLVQEGVWRTPDNSEILPYLNWAPSEPDNLGGQHCLAIFNAGGLQWDDNTCEVHNFALCKQS